MTRRGVSLIISCAAVGAACTGGDDDVQRSDDAVPDVGTEVVDDVPIDSGPGDSDPGDAGPGDSDPGDAGPGDSNSADVGSADSDPGLGSAALDPTVDDGPLADVCDDTISIQLDGLPSVEHGPLFSLFAADPLIDDDRQAVAGPLTRPDGTIEDVILDLRAGGPAVGFRSPLSVMADDPLVTVAEASTAESVAAAATFPTTAVIALTDISHDMVMWDPRIHPDVAEFADLAADGIEILHVSDEPFVEFLTATDVLDPAQLLAGFDGEPAAFVANGGELAQQGDALIDPFLYPTLPQWGRPIAFALASEAGWRSYDDTLAVRAETVENSAECLGRLVPILQAGIVAYADDPSPTNDLMTTIRQRFNPLTRIGPDVLNDGAAAAVETGIIGNGADGVIGTFDADRLDAFLPRFTDALDIDPVAASDIVTNRFLAPDRSL